MSFIWLISLRTCWNEELIKTKPKVISYFFGNRETWNIKKMHHLLAQFRCTRWCLFLYIMEMLEITVVVSFLLTRRAFNILTWRAVAWLTAIIKFDVRSYKESRCVIIYGLSISYFVNQLECITSLKALIIDLVFWLYVKWY